MFRGDSADAATGQPLGRVSSSITANDRYVGGDSTLSGNGTTLNGTALLIPLLIQASSIPPALGETFTISLDAAGTTLFDADFNTIPYSSTSGTVTIAAVPEPPSFALACLSMPLVLLAAVARRRLHRRRPESVEGRPPAPSREFDPGPVAVRA